MKYKYKNMKHVILHGMKPGEIKEFDHPIAGGGIKLITDEQKEKKSKPNKELVERYEKIKENDI